MSVSDLEEWRQRLSARRTGTRSTEAPPSQALPVKVAAFAADQRAAAHGLAATYSEGLSVRKSFTGARLAATGCSGFVGKVWLSHALSEVRACDGITALVRRAKGCAAPNRMSDALDASPAFLPFRQTFSAGALASGSAGVEVVEGDITRDMCGVDASAEWARKVDAWVHFASLTDFEPDPRTALAINIHGALHVADLCARSTEARFVYVSTGYVAGCVSGDVAEELEAERSPLGLRFDARAELAWLERLCASLPARHARIRAAIRRARFWGWPNIYTYSKSIAERLLSMREDIRLTIVRPTVVESALRFPFAGWNEGVNTSAPIVWLLSSHFRRFPCSPNHNFDVVPVDLMCNGLNLALAQVLLGGSETVYQLGSSDCNPMTFARAVELTALAARRRYRRSEASPWERWVLAHLDAYPDPERARNDWSARAEVRFFEQSRRLSDWLSESIGGLPLSGEARRRLHRKLRGWSGDLRQASRRARRIEELLRLYKPFIHDHGYRFRCDRVRALSASLVDEERACFAYDVDQIDWREYWTQVQVPGLERWSLPQLRGEKVKPCA